MSLEQATKMRLMATPRARTDKEHGPNGQHWAELRPTMVALSIGASSPPPSDDGKKSLGAPRLSPLFVEWMMGAPEGWTDPDCPLSATEFSCRQDGLSGSTCSSARER